MAAREDLEVRASETLELVFIDLDAAERAATALLEDVGPSSRARILLLRTLGLAARERQDLSRAEQLLREAHGLSVGEPDLHAAVGSSLALTVGYRGDWEEALALSGRSLPSLPDGERGRGLSQHALILHRLGRNEEASERYRAALAVLREEGDVEGLAKALSNAGLAAVEAGRLDVAGGWLEEAGSLARAAGLHRLEAMVEGNRGYLLNRVGDLVGALEALQRCEALWRAAGGVRDLLALVWLDRAAVLVEAGLLDEAADLADSAARVLGGSANSAEAVEVMLRASRILLACEREELAAAWSARAEAALGGQDRPGWLLQARYLRLASGDDPLSADTVLDLGGRLTAMGWSVEAREALLLGAQAASAAGRRDDARRLLDAVGSVDRAHRTTVVAQVQECLAGASLAVLDDDLAEVATRTRRAVELLLAHRRTLGSVELHARQAVHLQRLTRVWIEQALRADSAAAVLEALETTAELRALPREVRPAPDPELRSLLAELRALDARGEDLAAGGPGLADVRRRGDLEAQVLARERLAAAPSSAQRPVPEAARGPDVGKVDLVHLFVADGRLRAVVQAGGDARLVQMGAVEAAADLGRRVVSAALRHLRRPDRARGDAPWHSFAQAVEALLEPLGRRPGAPLVLAAGPGVPEVPWGIAPSTHLAGWVATRSLRTWPAVGQMPATGERTLVVEGPGLSRSAEEAAAVAALLADPIVLSGHRATSEAVLAALAETDCAHVVAHGTVDTANPLLSSLRVADGKLWAYEVAQLPRLPGLVVLAACSVGSGRRFDGGSVLGFSEVLLRGGTTAVVAPTLPLADEVGLVFSERLHRERLDGLPVPAAVARALTDQRLDPADRFVLQAAMVIAT